MISNQVIQSAIITAAFLRRKEARALIEGHYMMRGLTIQQIVRKMHDEYKHFLKITPTAEELFRNCQQWTRIVDADDIEAEAIHLHAQCEITHLLTLEKVS